MLQCACTHERGIAQECGCCGTTTGRQTAAGSKKCPPWWREQWLGHYVVFTRLGVRLSMAAQIIGLRQPLIPRPHEFTLV